MKRSIILLVDGIINIVLGILLITYLTRIVEFLGVPQVAETFYVRILGGVLLGIGIALFIETYRKQDGLIGLGLGGAIAINVSGGVVLTFLLLLGNLSIPIRGRVFLWCLVCLLVSISILELIVFFRKKRSGNSSS